MINKSKQLYCAFIDFSKAFDYVDRNSLWLKLIKLGVRGKMLDIVRSMYASVKSKVKSSNNLNNSFECHLGVRQGGAYPPFYFQCLLMILKNRLFSKVSMV